MLQLVHIFIFHNQNENNKKIGLFLSSNKDESNKLVLSNNENNESTLFTFNFKQNFDNKILYNKPLKIKDKSEEYLYLGDRKKEDLNKFNLYCGSKEKKK